MKHKDEFFEMHAWPLSIAGHDVRGNKESSNRRKSNFIVPVSFRWGSNIFLVVRASKLVTNW